MARGTPLSSGSINLLAMLKTELSVDPSTAIAPGGDAMYMSALSNMQNWLATEYDWPFLEVRIDIPMVAGTRYYNFPLNSAGSLMFEMEREIKALCYWSTLWYTVEAGISPINWNTLNPDLGQQMDPVLRWQPYNGAAVDNETVTEEVQFEVWPLPASGTTLRLTGQRVLNGLAQPTDKADLDDMLIVLFTAAKIALKMGQADAQAIAGEAQKRLTRLRAGIPAPSQVFSMKGKGAGSQRHNNKWSRPMVGVNYTR